MNKSLISKKLASSGEGVDNGLNSAGVGALNKVLASSGTKLTIDAAKTKVISMRTKKNSRTHLPSFWWAMAFKNGVNWADLGMDNNHTTLGAHIMESNGVVSFTAIFTHDKLWYGAKTFTDTMNSLKDCMGLSAQETSEGTSFRELTRKNWDAENLRFGVELNSKEESWMRIYRQFNNPYYLIGELK